MPWTFWLAFCIGPAVVIALRVITWIGRGLGYPRDPRPGYVDLTGKRAEQRGLMRRITGGNRFTTPAIDERGGERA